MEVRISRQNEFCERGQEGVKFSSFFVNVFIPDDLAVSQSTRWDLRASMGHDEALISGPTGWYR